MIKEENENFVTIHKILNISFNQDCSCFTIGTENGFLIFDTNNNNNYHERKMDGGIKQVEMLGRTNLLGLIGGGENPKFNPNKLIIWDACQDKVVCEIKFFSNLKNTKLLKNKIFAISERYIYVFDLKTFENIEIIKTGENPRGLIAINGDTNRTIIAYPGINEKGLNKGHVTVNYYDNKTTKTILAQDNPVSFISLNYEGTLLATSNEKGTIIKIHNCANGDLLSTFKRGTDTIEINYICFDRFSNFLAVSSDKGNINIWTMARVLDKIKNGQNNSKINNNDKINEKKNKNPNEIVIVEEFEDDDEDKNELEGDNNIIQNLPKNKTGLFNQNEKSFAKIKIDSNKCICTFQKNNIIIIIDYDGNFYQYQLDTKNGGNCKIITKYNLTDIKNKTIIK